jgi:hypothetical protein
VLLLVLLLVRCRRRLRGALGGGRREDEVE